MHTIFHGKREQFLDFPIENDIIPFRTSYDDVFQYFIVLPLNSYLKTSKNMSLDETTQTIADTSPRYIQGDPNQYLLIQIDVDMKAKLSRDEMAPKGYSN